MLARILSLVLIVCSTGATAQSWQSGPERVQLVELFTSEGCSSCPPADRWLTGLQEAGGLWRRLIPVALHVDYWDRLGWPDRFARAGFTQRQRDLALWNDARVYTPGFFVDGREWRGWFLGRSLPETPEDGGGMLRLSEDGGRVEVRFAPNGNPDGLITVHLARLGFGLETPIEAGENRGRTLRHDFVVTGYERAAATASDGGWVVEMPLPTAVGVGTREALVAWITVGGDPRPVQAVGGWRTGIGLTGVD
jgi:hypothetical protein